MVHAAKRLYRRSPKGLPEDHYERWHVSRITASQAPRTPRSRPMCRWPNGCTKMVAGARFVHSRHPDDPADQPLGFIFILVGWKMEVRQTFLAGPLMCVALRRQRSQVRILSGAPDFNDLANGIGHHLLSRKHHGSTRREVIGQFVALLSTREPKEPSPSAAQAQHELTQGLAHFPR
jgi:hypothetical protein